MCQSYNIMVYDSQIAILKSNHGIHVSLQYFTVVSRNNDWLIYES